MLRHHLSIRFTCNHFHFHIISNHGLTVRSTVEKNIGNVLYISQTIFVSNSNHPKHSTYYKISTRYTCCIHTLTCKIAFPHTYAHHCKRVEAFATVPATCTHKKNLHTSKRISLPSTREILIGKCVPDMFSICILGYPSQTAINLCILCIFMLVCADIN